MIDHVADVAAFFDHIDRDPMLLVGHSLGGGIALQFTGVMPERVRRVCAIEGLGPGIRSPRPAHLRMRDWLGSMRDLGYAGPESRNRHVITNHEVHLDGDRAAAHAYFQLVSGDLPASILAVGSYTDELRRTADGRWLFARRQIST